MNATAQPILRLPERIREETFRYRGQVERFLKGELSPMAFKVYRVPMGIYEQRTSGTYMVRVRIAAGIASSSQLVRIAELSRRHGNGVVHVTTRQDLQIHHVQIEQTPDVLEGLFEAGLSSRGGGGNTVRNVTACPRAGVCPFEQFNVVPYALAAAEYLLQFDSSYNLPRKYKIAFSGCSADCALASVADLGFFAHRRDGVKGFSAYAGGGLGPNAAVGVKIEDFVEGRDVLNVAEAVKQLFDKHGDRSNKHAARLRYVLARLGGDQFVRSYRAERQKIETEGLPGRVPGLAESADEPAPIGQDPQAGTTISDVEPEKKAGFFTVKLTLPLGDIPADDLVAVARLAERYGVGQVRATQQQDLLIPSVPQASLDEVRRGLHALSVDTASHGLPKVVACAGASTCKLGLCLSRGLAAAITDKLAQDGVAETGVEAIRISGCPNSCGQHYISPIAFQGRAKRVTGRLLPCYDVLVGAQVGEGTARLARTVGALPAKAVPDFVAAVLREGSLASEQVEKLIAAHAEPPAEEIPEDFYFDWGAETPFSLAGRGPGECGAGVMDLIAVDLKEAQTETGKSPSPQALYRAILAAARALLVIFGVEPRNDRETLNAFRTHLIEPGWVDPQAQKLLDAAVDWRMGDESAFGGLADALSQVEALVKRVEQLFLSLDANLKFRAEPIKAPEAPASAAEQVHQADLRGVACPLNFVKAKLALEKVPVGDILEIVLDAGEPIRNVPQSLADQGQEVLDTIEVEDHFLLRVRRTK